MNHSEFIPKSKYLQAAADEENRAQFTQRRFGIYNPEIPQFHKERCQELEACVLLFLLRCQRPVKLTEVRERFPDAGTSLVNQVKTLMVKKGFIEQVGTSYVYQLTLQGQEQAQSLMGGVE